MSEVSHLVRDVDAAEPLAGRHGRRSAIAHSAPQNARVLRRWPVTSRRLSVWREQVRNRLADLRVELDNLPDAGARDAGHHDAWQRLDDAATIIAHKPTLLGVWTGADVEAVWMRIHAIEVGLARLCTPA